MDNEIHKRLGHDWTRKLIQPLNSYIILTCSYCLAVTAYHVDHKDRSNPIYHKGVCVNEMMCFDLQVLDILNE